MNAVRPDTNSRSPLRFAMRPLLGALALTAAAAAWAGAPAAVQEPTIPSGVALASWQDNGHGGRYLLQLAQGSSLPPGGRTTGIVLSDSDCEPDAQGLNHCHNAVQLADGKLILLINTHVMARNRCLGAGDKLSLSAVGRSWMMAVVAHP